MPRDSLQRAGQRRPAIVSIHLGSAMLVCLICVLGNVAQSSEFRVGTGVADITPVLGTPMLTPMGSSSVKLSEEPLDALCVRAVVIDCGGRQSVIATCDLTSIPNSLFDAARELIVKETGIEADAIMISATHTHTAPQVRARYLGPVDADARRKAMSYIELLPAKIAEAVRAGQTHLRPAHGQAGVASERSVSFNRRFVMKDGTVLTNPGKNDPDLHWQIARPAGPIDPEIGIVYFESVENEPLATLTNFALHLDTAGGTSPSADFAAGLHRHLCAAKGPQMLSLFAIGAAGNINHYNLLNPAQPRRVKGPQESDRIGTALATAALQAFPTLQKLDCSYLRYARTTVELDLPREKGAALAARHNNAPQFFDGEVDVYNEAGRQWFNTEVQVIALGRELAWVGLPGEMFVEFGLAIKTGSPFQFTMIHTLANHSIGYVPNLRAYPEGSYEATSSRCAPGSGERLVEAATRLLVELKHQAPQLTSEVVP